MSEPFIAEIRMFGFTFAPRNWAFCNGQILSIAQNTALFSILGTTYGGNGQTTFALPNLQARAPMHWGQGPGLTARVLGESGGTESVTLLTTEMPAHSHAPACNTAVGNQYGPGSNYWSADAGGASHYTATGASQMAAGAIGITGGSGPHNNVQPFLAVNICICLFGVFPSRN